MQIPPEQAHYYGEVPMKKTYLAAAFGSTVMAVSTSAAWAGRPLAVDDANCHGNALLRDGTMGRNHGDTPLSPGVKFQS
jgi:hypothetical protein